jgi:DNA-binding transcriptional ArsR family regulator
MKDMMSMTGAGSFGDEFLAKLAALASPHRLRIVAALAEKPDHVSQLARNLGMSRPLLQMHLRKLEAAGLVHGRLELSTDGKAMKFYDLEPFVLQVDAQSVAKAAETLSRHKDS